jgi:RNA polymerase sigma-70 factor, ECF subfamily
MEPSVTADLNKTLADRDLVARAQAGEVLALNLLVTAVRKIAQRYCRSRLVSYSGGAEVAEDVTQEVCLAVVDALARYQDQGAPFVALVYAIASNKVADAQRRYARTPFHLVEELPERVETTLGPEQQAIERSDVAAALALLEQLPARTARVIRLRAEGRSADEVGEIMGMSANAVRVAQHRGLARLRDLVAASADHRERFADRRSVRVAA